MTIDTTDVVVIGGGVVGLACARKLAIEGLSTIVLEAEDRFGLGASSRNSEVIHAGLYYEAGSLKAKLCREGRELLYSYCQSRNIGHSQLGKWIVANSPAQIEQLNKIALTAQVNGCSEVYWLSSSEAQEQEPELIAEKVLVSPRTGIVDSHNLMLSLLADIEVNGGIFVPNTVVVSGRAAQGCILLKTRGVDDFEIKAKFVVNSAGIYASCLAKNLGCRNVPELPAKGFAKGNYFSLTGKPPFQRLIYPVPEPGGLGVHLTLSLDNQARFGPDVEWVPEINYKVNSDRKNAFSKEIMKYWRNFDAERLTPDYAGIRAKVASGAESPDFMISSPRDNGVPGLVNLFGIESPGLTSSLAIAEVVARKLNIN
ncbi:NAD(P)/FAD-dependent oxidoreductase [Pseudomonadota bacterium]|nr:NAD(P)/FAD-dependent oxidoreductase [Pseudomonadota bacterium]